MRIKLNKAPKAVANTISEASVALAGGTDGQIAQVLAFVKAVDCFQIGHVIASLRLSPEEARGLADRLVIAAGEAEALLQKEKTGASKSV